MPASNHPDPAGDQALPIFDRKGLRRHLEQFGIHAEKGLGQHFLASESAIRRIAEAVGEVESILEIGPGPGVLTQTLACIASVTAVELDANVQAALKAVAPEVNLILGDALKINLREVLDGMPAPRALVSNIPYYITGPLLERFAEVRDLYDVSVLMMQREVADRILAKAGDSDRGALSVAIQLQFQMSRVVNVPGADFLPPPKVDSTVLKFVPRERLSDEEGILRTVHFGFAQRRKTLVNNLVAGFRIGRADAEDLLESAGIDSVARAQELTEDQWIQLHHRLHPS